MRHEPNRSHELIFYIGLNTALVTVIAAVVAAVGLG